MKKNPLKEKNLLKQRKLTTAELSEIDRITQEAIANYVGDLSELESALGMLTLGYQYGWRVLYIIHSKATIRKYEGVLEISVKELFEEEGPSAERNVGIKIIRKIGSFWKVVSGEIKVADKRLVK
jgi:hypothetical protein